MGAALDTPATCPLCNELTRDPVILKCKHRFCQRCIGDLWSVSPNGPYRCPEWRCTTVYHSLPFDNSLIRRKLSHSPRPSAVSSAGTSRNNEQSTSDSALGRPSLSSRLLGKRKAGPLVTDQPDSKRSNLSPKEKPSDKEAPSTSLSDEACLITGVETVTEAPCQKPGPLTSTAESSGTCDRESNATNTAQKDTSVLIVERKSEEVVILDHSDNEVDICDAPLPASQNHTSPKKPAAASSSSPVIASPRQNDSSRQTSERAAVFTTHRVAPSDSTNYSPRSESNKNKPVPCNYCPKLAYQFAVKTCLVCGASMCTEHLRPHLDQPVFQNHTLVPPIEDISPWRCQEHQEMNRIFCRQCGVCVCTVCTVIGSHRDHVCISIREAERELRGNLKEEIRQLQNAEQQVKQRVTELKHKKESFEMIFSETDSGVKQQYSAIREALEQEEQMALQCVAKEEEKILGGLEAKLGHLQSSLVTIQQGLHSLEGLADAKGDKRIQDQAFIMEYGNVAQMSSAMGSHVEQYEPPEEINQAKLLCLQKWTEKRLDNVVITMPGKDRDLYRLLYGTSPVLDVDTAHPKLLLSDDKRTVTYSEIQQAYTENEARFSSFPQVLASSSLDRGRWYWEVQVSVDDGRWKVGISEGQIERKGQKDSSRLGFNSFSWCLACDRRKLEALHSKVATPVSAERLERVGVFFDFDEGILSFFNVTPGGSLGLMHSYKHQFKEPVYPAFSVSKTNVRITNLFLS